jgi:O-acetyl-ADP-ribose deacetylase
MDRPEHPGELCLPAAGLEVLRMHTDNGVYDCEGRPQHDGQVRRCHHVRVTFVQGDITEQDIDAIVNAANHSLLGGGGVDGAIHRRGGPEILAECQKLREERYPDGLPTGQAVATTAGRLKARWVIHTVGPTYAKSEDKSQLLADCFRNSLKIADELGAATVAFPAISTGVYRWPIDDAARIALETVRSSDTRVAEVRFVLFDQRAYEAFTSQASPGEG